VAQAGLMSGVQGLRIHPVESMADRFGWISEMVSSDSGVSGTPLLRTELIEHLVNSNVQGDVSSLSSVFSREAPDGGPTELGALLSERQELLLVNQSLRENCAEWTSAIRRVRSLLRGATAERNRLLQQRAQLQRILMSGEVSASTFSHLVRDDRSASLQEPITAISDNTLAPELDQVAAPRVSATAEQRTEETDYEAVPLQTPPLTRLRQSPIAMQVSRDPDAEQAELAVLRQQSDVGQGGRRRNRRRRQRQRQMGTPNGQHQVPFEVTSQINQEDVASDAQHHSLSQVSYLSNERQFRQHRQHHSVHPSVIHSRIVSSLHGRAMLVETQFPKAAAAA